MYLCYFDRECELVFSPSDWKSVYTIVHDRKLPETPPRLHELIRIIAILGGYVDRPKPNPVHNSAGRDSNDFAASHPLETHAVPKLDRSFFLLRTCVAQWAGAKHAEIPKQARLVRDQSYLAASTAWAESIRKPAIKLHSSFATNVLAARITFPFVLPKNHKRVSPRYLRPNWPQGITVALT